MSTVTRTQLLRTAGAAAIGVMLPRAAFAASRPYHRRVLEKKPVAYWGFEEGSGTTVRDSSGNHHAGRYVGGVALGQPGAIHGAGDRAIRLNGSDAYVNVRDAAVFGQPASGNGLTVEVWMRPDTLTFAGQTEQRYIHWLGKGEPGAYEWGFRFYSLDSPARPNRISAYIWNSTSAPGVSNEGAGAYFQDELRAGEWIHVVACFDPGDASDPTAGVAIYKNGELRESPQRSRGARYSSYDIHPTHGSAPVRLGTRDLQTFLTGALDEVAIYPRVLSASEILDNYMGA